MTTFQLARFVDWLADEERARQAPQRRTIANIVIPLRAALTTAKREGLIRHNPSQGLALPHREEIAERRKVKVFSREQLAAVLAMAPERHKLLFEVLAPTGLRISEAIALQRLHLQIDGSSPRSASVARSSGIGSSRRRRSTAGARSACRRPSSTGCAPIWRRRRTRTPPPSCSPTKQGGPIEPGNLRRRVLKPLVEEVDAPWAGFHTFRHTFASLHLSRGTNLLQLSRALGHHSAAFTLSRYTHLLPGDEAPALELEERTAPAFSACVSLSGDAKLHPSRADIP